MPRSGVNGTYSLPGAQATQVPGTPIPSAVNNQGWSDVEQTFNTPTPIAYGGTNASNAADALTNLGAASDADVVKKVPQTNTYVEQGQARANVDASVLRGFSNFIVNGCGVISQENTDVATVNTNGQYIVDQWQRIFDGTGATRSSQQSAFGVFASGIPGNPTTYVNISCTVAGSGNTFDAIRIPMEGVEVLANRRVTVTFTARSRTTSKTIPTINLRQNFGSGGSASVDTVVATNQVIGTNFMKVSTTLVVPDISGKTIGAGSSLDLFIYMPAAQTFSMDFSLVSTVLGDATKETEPFEPRPIEIESVLCKRFFEIVAAQNQLASAYATSQAFVAARDFVEKRASPTFTANIGGFSGLAGVSVNTIQGTRSSVGLIVNTSSPVGTAGVVFVGYTVNARL